MRPAARAPLRDALSYARRMALGMFMAALAGAPAHAAPPQAAPFAPPHIEQQVSQARLAGQGEFTWFGLRIYEAQLWVGPQGYQPGAPEAAPFALDLRYARALDGQRIAQASADQMKKIGAGSEAQRQAWLLTMRATFPDVKEGSHLSGTYLPGVGVRFHLDGKALAEVPDPQFALAFFAIWLAPASSAPQLRAALLAGAGPRP
ncbi:MAG: chalcone isomerase family protein [Pseudomonadota bacterium]